MSKLNILFLYSEVMGYTLATIKEIIKSGYEVHLIYWDENKKTPFLPEAHKGLTLYKRSECNLSFQTELIERLSPLLMYVSGRMDHVYLQSCLFARKKGIKVISGFDNQWISSYKNWLSIILSPILYKRYFDYLWVPGKYQYVYAKKLGYRQKVLFNLYSANTSLFNISPAIFSKRFIFTGRFNEVKGIRRLCDAFRSIDQKEWKLLLIGNGPLKEEITKGNNIEVYDFMQPVQLAELMKSGGVFVLPSYYDAWGVVLHEFAIASFPLVCSNTCGASTIFVRNDYNGYVFNNDDDNTLKEALENMMNKSIDELKEMGTRSHELALTITPEISAASFLSVIQKY